MYLLNFTGWYKMCPETKKSQASNLGFDGKHQASQYIKRSSWVRCNVE